MGENDQLMETGLSPSQCNGWDLMHTEDELKRILAEVEAHRRAQVTKEYVLHIQAKLDILIHQAEPRGRIAASQGHVEHPVIAVTSMHQLGKPQSFLVDTTGVWRIKISAVLM